MRMKCKLWLRIFLLYAFIGTSQIQQVPPASAAVSDPGFRLPWEYGQEWWFIGGPHLAWEAGTPWGAVDFQPPNSVGCEPKEATSWWIRPAARGKVTRADSNYIEIDHENGWRTVYYHIGSIQVNVNAEVFRSTNLGHPSCFIGAGGRADGRHVHLAFKRDGAWIDLRSTSVRLSGWEIKGGSTGQYSGSLQRDGIVKQQWSLVTNDWRDDPTCPGPALTEPSRDAKTSRDITFRWQGLSGCTFNGYTLRVKANQDMNDISNGKVIDQGVGGTSFPATINGYDNTQLYWAVRAANSSNAAWSEVRPFRISPGDGCEPRDDNIVLYADERYDGARVCLGVGDYPNPGHLSPVGNDNADSIRVGSRVEAEVCKNDDFKDCTTYGGSDERLANRQFGSAVSSVRVKWRQIEKPTPISPKDDQRITEGSDIVANWTATGDEYFLQTWGGPSGPADYGWLGSASHNIGTRHTGYRYSWKVKARRAGQESPESDVATYVVVPKTPTNLGGTVDGCAVNLTWGDASSNEDSYRVFRNGPTGGWQQIASLPVNTTTYRDTGLSHNTLYYYRVNAAKNDILSGESNAANFTTDCPSPPGKPTLTGPASGSVFNQGDAGYQNLHWNAVANATAYFVEVVRYPTASTSTSGWITATTWSPGSLLTPGQKYSWRVKARNQAGVEGPWSDTWHFFVRLPTTGTVMTTIKSCTSVEFVWAAHSWSPQVTGDEMRVYRRGPGGVSLVAHVGPFVWSHLDAGLTENTTYQYWVTAYRPSVPEAESLFSREVEVRTPPCTVDIGLRSSGGQRVQPQRRLHIELRARGSDTLLYEYVPPSGPAEIADFTFPGVTPGDYDLSIKPQMGLRTRQPITLQKGLNIVTYDEKSAAGDILEDNVIDIFDYSLVVSNFGATRSAVTVCRGDIDYGTSTLPGYVNFPDTNCNGSVDIFDYSAIVSNFGKAGVGEKGARVCVIDEACASSVASAQGQVRASAQRAGTLTLTPASASAAIGTTTTVDLRYDTAGHAVTGLSAILTFDPKIVQIEGVTFSQVFADRGADQSDAPQGRLRLNGRVQTGQSVTGAGVFATVTFKLIAAGSSSVQISYVRGRTDSSAMPLQGKAIQVVGSVTGATLTATIPTQSPTVTPATPTPTPPTPSPTSTPPTVEPSPTLTPTPVTPTPTPTPTPRPDPGLVDPALPGPVALRLGKVTTSSIQLAWTDVARTETRYVVAFRPRDGNAWTYVGLKRNARSWTHARLARGVSFVYAVRACGPAGCSPWSGQVIGSTPPPPPLITPSNLRVGKVTSSAIQLRWNDNTVAETRYVLAYRPAGSQTWTFVNLKKNTATWTHKRVPLRTQFAYRVQACDASKCTAWTPEVYSVIVPPPPR
ncbi:MAG: peptidoglycan DD-metalloendopeptidase family protein [Chloroflexi bacterium]|nr:peptidoglycan DD-metalloendopeptidase family protein [Chloroflexota bacterium]